MKRISLLLALALTLGVAAWASGSTSVNGWITDDKCGAKGAHAGAEACAKKCIEAGAKPVIVSDTDQSVLTIDNPDKIKGHEGHHVTATGTVDTAKKTIHIDSVKMMAEAKPSK